MGDVELVVRISEEDYNNIEPFLNGETIKGGFNLFKVLEIIKNGTPLSKRVEYGTDGNPYEMSINNRV